MSRIAAVATALPSHAYPQQAITDLLAPIVAHDPRKQALMRRMHASSRVATRHLVLPLEEYRDALTFGQTNDRFVEEGTRLAESAVRRALAEAGVRPDEVDLIVFTSVTGLSAPSVDALLVPRLGMREDVKRMPMFGLGCVAGASGIARVHDYLEGHPEDVALLVSVELCSLTVQKDDDSVDNLVASGLFGDGAAAVVLVGAARAAGVHGPDVVATRSRLYPGSGSVIGFRPSETGFRVILTAGVVDVIDANFAADATAFLTDHGLGVPDVATWIAHPGGPKVLDAFQRGLDLPAGALDRSWASMAAVGNLSSSSVLHVLADELRAPHDDHQMGLLFALGPGVSAELVLLRWPEAAEALAAA
ncbi:type III polyketide synthase [Amnibacterium kyonggiense]|uniref:type III polyketide synthase n=1 Tax=Amnibacterium kyonggiense TaxID=595671 RepID=UPI00105C0CF5|nr:type III polyketide synthase [Amnibacterium kyonggiense]